MSAYSLTPEQLALYNLAKTTWRRRGTAKRLKLAFSEESVTDTILSDLAETFPGQVVIVPFTKVQEGKNGADWAWLFQDASGTKNFPILVQAKALDFADRTYPKIKYLSQDAPPIRQIDLLIATAEQLGWPALYAFYNHLADVSRIPDQCSSISPIASHTHLAESWGISFADAYAVRTVLNDQTFDTHRHHSMPLHCLLCSQGLGNRGPGGSPEQAKGALSRLAARVDGSTTRPTISTFDSPPELFRRALSLMEEQSEERRLARAEALAHEFPGISGAIILQDS